MVLLSENKENMVLSAKCAWAMVAQNLCDWSINVWFNLMLTLQEDFHDYDQEEETEQPRDLVWNQMRLKKKKNKLK